MNTTQLNNNKISTSLIKPVRKLFVIGAFSVLASYAGAVDMSKLYCDHVKLTKGATLAETQAKCHVKKQYTKDGLYVVELKNDESVTYTCNFASNTPTAVLNGCK